MYLSDLTFWSCLAKIRGSKSANKQQNLIHHVRARYCGEELHRNNADKLSVFTRWSVPFPCSCIPYTIPRGKYCNLNFKCVSYACLIIDKVSLYDLVLFSGPQGILLSKDFISFSVIFGCQQKRAVQSFDYKLYTLFHK